MKNFLTAAFLLILSSLTFAYTPEQIDKDLDLLFLFVPLTETVKVQDKEIEIDMRKLLEATARLESRKGTNNYSGRVAKTYMQYEISTINTYSSTYTYYKNRSLCEYYLLEPLNLDDDRHAVFIAYVLYMTKLHYHQKLLANTYTKYHGSEDPEFWIYKVLWNSTKGASTFKKWKHRLVENI